ncbi:DUF3662 and FHA domain-containing protein [Kineosporia sp. NBRC 101731]|uniref:FhaA domain-containing protein n=1 Tax=Kineosporia sp. NBRC 101731 TaxID=3032199 RepID=UPI0024A33A9C|nr:DUF3662 and FHA domain-containing protein [Kineosporia sp. NBRC 101731]GLY26783.1 phosphopeptide-binding protein [Kineosporia sp. NBRC 101731]
MFDRMEKGIERAVNGAFAKAFRSEVQPVEIASALRREIDDRATVVARGRTLAPNTFVVELGAGDHERLGEWEDTLGDELRDVVAEHAGNQEYSFVGPITVRFEEAQDLDTGLFRVRSTTTRGTRPQQSHPQQQALSRAPQQQQHRPGQGYGQPPAQQQQPDHPSLVVDGRVYPITAPVTVIGRGTEADVIVDDIGVSRRHAEVRVEHGRLIAADLGSTNGTYVDGERINTAEVVDGSQIKIGRSTLVIRFGSW